MEQYRLRRAQIREWRLSYPMLCYIALALPIITVPYLVMEDETVRVHPTPKNVVEDHRSHSTFDIERSSTLVTSALKDPLPSRNFAGRTTMDSSVGFIPSENLTSRRQEALSFNKFPGQKHIMNAFGTPRNVTSAPNELPDLFLKLRPQLLRDVPRNYSSQYKTPCYFTQDGKVHCLPYFFLDGMPKSGTTDIFAKISRHPDVVNHLKEPHWWTRQSISKGDNLAFQSFFDEKFTRHILKRIADGSDPKRLIIGDGSASTFWEMSNWMTVYPEYRASGPPYTVADLIHTFLPNSKHVVTFRDPTARLYSDYNFMPFYRGMPRTPELFHEKVVNSMNTFIACLKKRSLRGCTYETMATFCKARVTRQDNVRIWIGIYYVYTKDWLERFPRDQLMFITLEEWSSNCIQVLRDIFSFLDVAELPPEELSKICSESRQNVLPKTNWRPMLNSTAQLLRDFYRPYVKKLATLLQNDKFSWDY